MIRRSLAGIILVCLCLVGASRADDGRPIIPGAAGFGINTPAGSGRHLTPARTRVIKVTNLNDDGPGSLRDALENQPGPKVIVFEVSGNIALKHGLSIGTKRKGPKDTDAYITIAGQTAPSPGITIKDYGLEVQPGAHDILIQHLRFRSGDTSCGGLLKDGWTHVKGTVFSHPLVSKPNVGWGKGIGVTWNGATLNESKALEPNTKYADQDVPMESRVDKPPVWVEGYHVLPTLEVRDYVLANAGARPADRDPVDLRVVDQVRNDTKQAGGIIASQEEVGGWPVLAENHRALTPPEHPDADDDGDGYTNLENWLHGFAAEVERTN